MTRPPLPAFALATYVDVLDADLGEPLAILQAGGRNAELPGEVLAKALPSTER
jgi:hypothetical protein